jgi:tetratricopeptide (TPR) repeat protein
MLFLTGGPAMSALGAINKAQLFVAIVALLCLLGLLSLSVLFKDNKTRNTSSRRQTSEEQTPPPRQIVTEEKKRLSQQPAAPAEKNSPPQMAIGEQKSPPPPTMTEQDKTPSKQTPTSDASVIDALHLGNTYFDAKAYGQAIQQYDYAIAHGAPAHYIRGRAWLEKQNYDQAIADFTQAIQQEAGYYLSYFYRAQAYAHKDDRDKAIADYQQALKLKPDKATTKQIIAGLEALGVQQKDEGVPETKQRAQTKHRTRRR